MPNRHPNYQRKFTAVALMAMLPLLANAGIHIKDVPIEERTKGAQKVAIVEIESTQSEKEVNEKGDNLIVTRAKVKVKEKLKGKFEAAPTDLIIEGGELNGITLRVSDQPELKPGEQYVAFLNEKEKGKSDRPHRRGLGLMKIKGDKVDNGMSLDEVREKVKKAAQTK